MTGVDKEIKLNTTVANGVPWVYLERERRGKRGSSNNIVWFSLTVNGSQPATLSSPLRLASLPSFLGRE